MKTASSSRRVHVHTPDDFDHMVDHLQAHFDRVLAAHGPHLFHVETGADLFKLYIRGLPLRQRQYHKCHCCRKFIERFGSLAAIAEDGTLVPAMWDADNVPALYAKSVEAMATAVQRGEVTGVAFHAQEVWGEPVTGEWTHFAIRPPRHIVFRGDGQYATADEATSAKRHDHEVLMGGLEAFKPKAVAQAVTLLESNSLDRSEAVIGSARFLHGLHQTRKQVKGRRASNLTWRAVAAAPTGFCHPRSTMLGTLLEDIASGYSFDAIKLRFGEKMDGDNYQRSQADPSEGNIARAEKIVDRLGIESSLRRRAARLDEIPTIWTPKRAARPAAQGVFSHLRKPLLDDSPSTMHMPPVAITWAKFARDVLPKAERMECYVTGVMDFCGLLTAVDPDAPPILQWDSEEDRNPVSWYVYTDGSRPERWGLPSNTWVKVAAVTLQPSMWAGEDKFPHHGRSAIFVLEGAVDHGTPQLGLFPNLLKASLREVRATIEAHSNQTTPENLEAGSANGLRVGRSDALCAVRVATDSGVVIYDIDRWE
jgi:hypothetical protein